ncbi:hypothetical protein [Algoriphagus sp.]|uniref:hypothetical protein n=1 Tax=Algoriphagus sp. TaxID=1872435 RepID=UPI003F717279
MKPQSETIFNLYVFSILDLITEVGAVSHLHEGNDDEKVIFLKNNVYKDFEKVQRFPVPENFKIKINGIIRTGIDYTSYRNLCNEGNGLLIFERVFQHFNASSNPLVVVTPVKNGEIFIEGNEKIKIATTSLLKFVHIDKKNEWYIDYIDEKGFHFDNLINDDFFEAIRILFNAKQYVSSMKLLMICIDTVSYLEFGDVPRNFQNWLETYANLDSLDITSDELWEFRNSVLHMTNLDSRKVQTGKVKRLTFYVAHPSSKYVKETDEGKTFSFKELLDILATGIGKWALSYNIEKEKFEIFLSRYDRIISDKRMTTIYYNEKYSS